MKKAKINKFFIPLIVVFFIVALSYTIYYYIAYGDKAENEKTLIFLFAIFLSSFIGAMVFLPSHLEFIENKEYNFLTALSNYFLMILESSSMILALYLLGDEVVALNWYFPIFYLTIYMFFGMHLFSYPKNFKKSFTTLFVNILYVVLNLLLSHDYVSVLVNQFSKVGYVFTLSLIVAGFLMFFKPFLYLYKSKSKDESNKKILFIYSTLYLFLIFIPGMIFYLPALKNYFEADSYISLLINILYFVYIMYIKIKRMTAEFINFISV